MACHAPGAQAAEDALAAGAVVLLDSGTVEIQAALGTGSFGTVWAGITASGLDVAVKEMGPFATPQELKVAQEEARILQLVDSLRGLVSSAGGAPPSEIFDRMPALVAEDVAALPTGLRYRLAMSRLPGSPLDEFYKLPVPGATPVQRWQDACAFTLQFLRQLSEVFQHICPSMLHRDVNSHNVLVEATDAADPNPRFSIIDFGLARKLADWRGPLGPSSWHHEALGGDCRYWPVGSWFQFLVGWTELVKFPGLAMEYEKQLDLHAMGLTAVELLSALATGGGADFTGLSEEVASLLESWRQYWTYAVSVWTRVLSCFRTGGDVVPLRAALLQEAVYNEVGVRLKSLRSAIRRLHDAPMQVADASGSRADAFSQNVLRPLCACLLELVSEGGATGVLERHCASDWNLAASRLAPPPEASPQALPGLQFPAFMPPQLEGLSSARSELMVTALTQSFQGLSFPTAALPDGCASAPVALQRAAMPSPCAAGISFQSVSPTRGTVTPRKAGLSFRARPEFALSPRHTDLASPVRAAASSTARLAASPRCAGFPTPAHMEVAEAATPMRTPNRVALCPSRIRIAESPEEASLAASVLPGSVSAGPVAVSMPPLGPPDARPPSPPSERRSCWSESSPRTAPLTIARAVSPSKLGASAAEEAPPSPLSPGGRRRSQRNPLATSYPAIARAVSPPKLGASATEEAPPSPLSPGVRRRSQPKSASPPKLGASPAEEVQPSRLSLGGRRRSQPKALVMPGASVEEAGRPKALVMPGASVEEAPLSPHSTHSRWRQTWDDMPSAGGSGLPLAGAAPAVEALQQQQHQQQPASPAGLARTPGPAETLARSLQGASLASRLEALAGPAGPAAPAAASIAAPAASASVAQQVAALTAQIESLKRTVGSMDGGGFSHGEEDTSIKQLFGMDNTPVPA